MSGNKVYNGIIIICKKVKKTDRIRIILIGNLPHFSCVNLKRSNDPHEKKYYISTDYETNFSLKQ